MGMALLLTAGLWTMSRPGVTGTAGAAELEKIPVAYLSQIVERPPKLSNLDLPPEDEGIAGGLLSIKDNNTTGRFMGQEFILEYVEVPADGDAVAAFEGLIAGGVQHVVLNVPAAALIEMADRAKGKDVLLFNAGAMDDRLRNADCRANLLHIVPSRAMMADALAQFLVWKRWRNWFLIVGSREGDALLGDAFHRAARRFGGKIVEERRWDYGPDARRTAQAEVPAFTQDVDYDVLVIADEIGEFGEYLAYRTWDPRPIVGTQGLTPTTWHRTHEQWGAAQLQSRFLKATGRDMTPLDYHVWAAIRAIGEGATRSGSAAFTAVRDYIRGPDFELGGFKGQKLTFRDWNGQLRQPILLAAPRALVSASPQQGFLHERTLLDTLGYDKPESECHFE
jgi:ABC transporter substrate binding protein (PQQ-dependent alcohol dehydrogenase system)